MKTCYIRNKRLCCFTFQLESPHDFAELSEKYIDLFQAAGFRKLLTENTKEEAVSAIKCHFGFYYKLGPLLQYIDGQYSSNLIVKTLIRYSQELSLFRLYVCIFILEANKI